jgi:hypothetical protein
MGNWVRSIIPVVAIAAWAVIVMYRMYVAKGLRDQAHRERMAMIERGLTPPPDSDPHQFERVADWHPSSSGGAGDPAARHRRTGITLMGVGAGLSVMLYVLGEGRTAGSGAFLIVLGLAFLVNSMFDARSSRRETK